MAIAFVQGAINASGGASSLTVSLTGVAVGSGMILFITTSGSGTTVSSVSSDKGETFTRRVPRLFVAGIRGGEVWYAENAVAGNHVVTVNLSASVIVALTLEEYSGVALSGGFDQQASASGTSATAATANVTTTQADELIWGASATAGTTYTAGTGFTIRDTAADTTNATQSQVVSSTGAYASSIALGASTAWTAYTLTIKAAVAATGSLFRPPTLSGIGSGGPFFHNPLS